MKYIVHFLLSLFLFSFISNNSLAAVQHAERLMPSLFAKQLSQSKTQKDLIENSKLNAEQRKEAFDFLRKYKKEGLPVPGAKVKGASLFLQFNDGSYEIDFSNASEGIYRLGGVEIKVNPTDNLETIYKKLNSTKTSLLDLFVSKAFAADHGNSAAGSRVYAVLFVFSAEKMTGGAIAATIKQQISGDGSNVIGAECKDDKLVLKINNFKSIELVECEESEDGKCPVPVRVKGSSQVEVVSAGVTRSCCASTECLSELQHSSSKPVGNGLQKATPTVK